MAEKSGGRKAVAVVDLGFGDAGKGLVVDYLTRSLAASAVVRFNGGAQAGHNVVTSDGRHHTFAQFGAGTFVDDALTWLGPDVVIHPTALLVEAAHLESQGVSRPLSRLHVHDAASVITPFDQATGRIRELARGDARHGSCGVGVGEVAAGIRRGEPLLRAAALRDSAQLARFMSAHRERKLDEVRRLLDGAPRSPALERELAAFDVGVAERWTDLATQCARAIDVADDASWYRGLGEHRVVVFEGAQGVLLDREHGFYPHVSPGDCTLASATSICQTLGVPLTALGVVRSYTVRHGAGPLPGELTPAPGWSHEEHNMQSPWQGTVRVSPLDLVLTRHALSVVGAPIDGLVVTHADRVLPSWSWITTYGDDPVPAFASLTLREREDATLRLARFRAEPTPLSLGERDPGTEFARQVAKALDVPLKLVAHGPTAKDVTLV